MRFRKVLALAAAVLAMSVAVPSATADQKPPKSPKPTVVLVHGAFAESASWNGVVQRLKRDGYPVVAVANPLRSLSGDAAYVRKVLSTINGPVVIAGHSYGGMVLSNAATGNPNVKSLVYIASFAPERGESTFDLANKYPGNVLGEALDEIDLGDGTHDLVIQQDKFRSYFAADVDRETAELAAATQRPVRDAALAEASGEPAWHGVPSWFLLTGKDRTIPLEAQKFMAKRAKARGVVELPRASHGVTMSEPGAVTDLIIRAAR